MIPLYIGVSILLLNFNMSFDFSKTNVSDKFDLEGFQIQVQNHYNYGKSAVQSLRTQLEEEDIKFHDQSANREKINDYSFFALHSALMARIYSDKPKVTFKNQAVGIPSLIAQNLNNAFQTDIDTPEMARINYQVNYDAFKSGVGTLVRVGWDSHNLRAVYEVANPLLIIPDPDWDYIQDIYKFIGFESEKFANEFPKEWQNIDDLPDVITELTLKSRTLKTNAGMINNYQLARKVVYSCFEYWEWSLYFSVWGNNRTTLLYIIKYDPELPEELTNNFVAINKFVHTARWKPKRDSFFGHRLAVFALNVQEARSLIATLRFMMEKSVLHPMYIANTRMIQDRTDLDFGFNKVIFANPMEWEPLSNVMMPIQKDRTSANPSQVDRELEQQLSKVTGGMSGDMINGQETSRRETLGTNQLQQGNADINLSLVTKIGTWFEEYLAWGWFRSILENFQAGDKKIVELKTGLGEKYIVLRKKDLVQNVFISIKVESFFELKKQNDELAINLAQLLAETANQNISESARMALLRDLTRARGIDEEKVQIYLYNSPQEQLQIYENIALAQNEFVPVSPNDDDLAHIFIGKLYWIDTDASEIHNIAHVQAYIAKWGDQSVLAKKDENAAALQQSMAGQNLANQVASSNWQMWWIR